MQLLSLTKNLCRILFLRMKTKPLILHVHKNKNIYVLLMPDTRHIYLVLCNFA